MKLTYNNLENPDNTLSIVGVPNILTISDTPETNKAALTIPIPNSLQITSMPQININGITLTSTNNLDEVKNNVFYWQPYADKSYVAYTISSSLNNSNLSASYNISTAGAAVFVEAKQAGSAYNIVYEGDFAATPMNVTDNSILTNSNVQIQLYDDFNRQHLMTLEKRYLSDKLSFNLSPAYNSLLNNGEILECDINIFNIKNGKMTTLDTISRVKSINGYKLTPNSPDYITLNNVHTLLQDVYNGKNNNTYANNTTLYYYNNQKVPITLHSQTITMFDIIIKYYDSAMQVIQTVTQSVKPLTYHTIYVTPNNDDAYAMTVQIPEVGTLLYHNIDKHQYANPDDVQTLYFYNSFGGISHFTFAHKREDRFQTKKETIEGNVFDYYNNPNTKNVYINETTQTTTLTSHYINLSSTYTLQDLNKSSEVWYIDNNNIKRNVIVDEVNINKINNKQYQAEVTYVN